MMPTPNMTGAAMAILMATVLTACDSSIDPTEPSTQQTTAAAIAAAGKAVDPAALTPAPLLVGAQAECQADGRWIICHTVLAP